MRDYFRRFNDEVPKVRKTSDETLKNFFIAGVRPGTDFWKELQGREPETLSDFYSRAESHKVIEESMLKLPKTLGSEGQGGWNKNKRVRSFILKNRNTGKNTYDGGANGTKTSAKDEKTQPITMNMIENWVPSRGRGSGAKVFLRYKEYTPWQGQSITSLRSQKRVEFIGNLIGQAHLGENIWEKTVISMIPTVTRLLTAVI